MVDVRVRLLFPSALFAAAAIAVACANVSGLAGYDVADGPSPGAVGASEGGGAAPPGAPPNPAIPPADDDDSGTPPPGTPPPVTPPPPPGTPPPVTPPPPTPPAPALPGVRCGKAQCAANQVCCVSASGESCANACAPSVAAYPCDGPEDCDGVCCAFGQKGTGAEGSVCTASCAINSIVCHLTRDCIEGRTCQQGVAGAPAAMSICAQ